MPRILVVDDEIGIRELLSEILTDEGYTVSVAADAAGARAARQAARPDLVLLDIWMPDLDGISLLKEWKSNGQLNMPVVVMSGHATIDTAVEATRIGAVDFLEKPIALQKLLGTVKHALRQTGAQARSQLHLGALTRSAPMRELKKRLEQIARGSRIVQLKGVFGGLAELTARTLHQPQTPWLDMGQSTSALSQEQLQRMQGGIVFCPDLAALGKMQLLNLAFLLERLDKFDLSLIFGSSRPVTALDLGWDAALTRRLTEVSFSLPELARCPEDIPDIAALLLSQLVENQEVPRRELSSGALNRLRQQSWEDEQGGWMRLYAVLRNLALVSLDEEITLEEVDTLLGHPEPASASDTANTGPNPLQAWFELPLREARDAFEKSYFEYVLQREQGNMTRVAEQAGLERTHLYRKLKQLGVASKRHEEPATQ